MFLLGLGPPLQLGSELAPSWVFAYQLMRTKGGMLRLHGPGPPRSPSCGKPAPTEVVPEAMPRPRAFSDHAVATGIV